jgi:hypothetical protein
MRLPCFLVLLLVWVFSFGQKGPEITFDYLSLDRGLVGQGAYRYTFPFTNTGDSTLVIATVKSSCGCVAPDFSREPVLPGGRGMVSATFSTMGKTGPQIKSLTVQSNAKNPWVILQLKANVFNSSVRLAFFEFPGMNLITREAGHRPLVPNRTSGHYIVQIKNEDHAPVKLDASAYNHPSAGEYGVCFTTSIPAFTSPVQIADQWGKSYTDTVIVNGGETVYMVVNYSAAYFRNLSATNNREDKIPLPIGCETVSDMDSPSIPTLGR